MEKGRTRAKRAGKDEQIQKEEGKKEDGWRREIKDGRDARKKKKMTRRKRANSGRVKNEKEKKKTGKKRANRGSETRRWPGVKRENHASAEKGRERTKGSRRRGDVQSEICGRDVRCSTIRGRRETEIDAMRGEG